ncbi:hypothetical protein L195_g026336, partial [Trifolium pratense]
PTSSDFDKGSLGVFLEKGTDVIPDVAPETVIDQNVSNIAYQMNTAEKENTTKVMMTAHALISSVLVFVMMFVDVFCYESSHPDLICSCVNLFLSVNVLCGLGEPNSATACIWCVFVLK